MMYYHRGETKRTHIFNDRPFVINGLSHNLVEPYVFPHISITTAAGRIIAWDNIKKTEEDWGPAEAKSVSAHIGTISVSKEDADPYKGFLYGLGFYFLDNTGRGTNPPYGTVITVKISGNYVPHSF